MRELKFRCWDKQTKQMSPEFTLFGEFLLIGAVHAWQYECGNKSTDSLEALNDLEVMQWTGLKDKNGKEIYEGDIVRQPNKLNKESFGEYSLKEVKYNNGGFILSYLTSDKGKVIPRDYTAGFITDYGDVKIMLWGIDPYRMNDLEVIGNVYANPELLKP